MANGSSYKSGNKDVFPIQIIFMTFLKEFFVQWMLTLGVKYFKRNLRDKIVGAGGLYVKMLCYFLPWVVMTARFRPFSGLIWAT